MFAVGVVLLASSALLAPWLQTLAGYPVQTAGLVMAPRGVGTMAAMLISGRLANRVDPRGLMALGFALLTWSLWRMTGWTPDVDAWTVVINTVVQGAGLGFVFIPLQVVAFATLPAELRTDATALLSLLRNVGSAVGVSATFALLARNTQVEHADLAAQVTPFNHALHGAGAAARLLDPATAKGAALLDAVVNQQAAIVAYVDDFKALMLATAPAVLLLLLMRRPAAAATGPGHPPAME